MTPTTMPMIIVGRYHNTSKPDADSSRLKQRNANGTNGGWVYTVNDEEVMVGCTEYVLEPGDVIQWSYITW